MASFRACREIAAKLKEYPNRPWRVCVVLLRTYGWEISRVCVLSAVIRMPRAAWWRTNPQCRVAPRARPRKFRSAPGDSAGQLGLEKVSRAVACDIALA